MNCQECNHKRLQDESALAMAERTIRRLWITTLVLILALVGVCVGFFLYEAQFEEYEETGYVETDIGAVQLGTDNYVVGGDVMYVPSRKSTD